MVGVARDCYVGNEVRPKYALLDVSRPVAHEDVTDWNDMEKLWNHTFYSELGLSPDEHPLLFTEPSRCSKDAREKMTQLCFELYNPPAFYMERSSVLALHGSGRLSGVVLDCGFQSTSATPVYEGKALEWARQVGEWGGEDLSTFMHHAILARTDLLPDTRAGRDTSCSIKERLCSVALDFQRAMAQLKTTTDLTLNYELPDGSVIQVGDESIRCPEVLFDPSLATTKAMPGVHHLITNAIKECDRSLQATAFDNIVLAGGGSMFKGFADRLHIELSKLSPSSTKIRVIAPPDRYVECLDRNT